MEQEDELLEEQDLNDDVSSSDDLEETEPDSNEPVSSDAPNFDAAAVVNDVKKVAKIARVFIANPWLIPVIIVISAFLIICVIIATDDSEASASQNSGNKCTYKLSGIDNNSVVTIDNPQVELINCDATKDNYTVLKTIDFEKYVLGVALAEAGENINDEATKAQIIATRTFTLTRNLSMCPNDPTNCWLGYNQEENIIRMRACTNDQVYWDYTEDTYRLVRGDDTPSLYSPEINANTSGATLWKSKLSDERKAEVEFLASEVMGKIITDSSGNIATVGYNNTYSTAFKTDGDSGMNYEQILTHNYGSINFTSASCTSRSSVGNIDFGDYSLSSEGDVILSQRLDTFLESQGSSLEEYNNTILTNINNAGYGTRAGVVAAAITLIGELGDKYDVRLPYYWGGAHDSSANLASGSWGGSTTKKCNKSTCYTIDGLDCSGFVSWAINNGGFIYSALSTSQLSNYGKTTLSASTAVIQPGDLLLRSGHVKLVVGIDEENKEYITAEASGKSEGVKFGTMSFSGKTASYTYWGVNMDFLYNDSSKVRG
jgi:hypothetical protein